MASRHPGFSIQRCRQGRSNRDRPSGRFDLTPPAAPVVRAPAARFVAAPAARVAIASALIVAALLLAIGLFHVSRRKHILHLGYRLSQTRNELRLLREDNRRLRVELSVLTNPERIERLARTLGMIEPLAGQIRVVRGGATTRERSR